MPTTTVKPTKRKTSQAKPGHRSLAQCKKNGWRAQVVEKWVPQARRRVDLFGFIDLVALDGQPGLLGIQATSTANAPSRVRKILEDCTEAAIEWLQAGNRIEVWGWAKRGARGKRKLWTLKRYTIRLSKGDLTHEVMNDE